MQNCVCVGEEQGKREETMEIWVGVKVIHSEIECYDTPTINKILHQRAHTHTHTHTLYTHTGL